MYSCLLIPHLYIDVFLQVSILMFFNLYAQNIWISLGCQQCYILLQKEVWGWVWISEFRLVNGIDVLSGKYTWDSFESKPKSKISTKGCNSWSQKKKKPTICGAEMQFCGICSTHTKVTWRVCILSEVQWGESEAELDGKLVLASVVLTQFLHCLQLLSCIFL